LESFFRFNIISQPSACVNARGAPASASVTEEHWKDADEYEYNVGGKAANIAG
jgi:hypothetical protein